MKRKRKIKKYLFTINEMDTLFKMMTSDDKEIRELAYSIFITSRPYRHYKYMFLNHLSLTTYPLTKDDFCSIPYYVGSKIQEYLSHYKYIK